MADSDSKDSTDQYNQDLVNISIDADNTGSDISVYTADPDQILTMGVKGKHCDNAGRASFRYALCLCLSFFHLRTMMIFIEFRCFLFAIVCCFVFLFKLFISAHHTQNHN